MRYEIEFTYTRKDVNLLVWITRIEKEIDEYIETNGKFSDNLAHKFYEILYDLMTNFNANPLMEELDRVLSQKLNRPATLNDVLALCQYLKIRMKDKQEAYQLKPKYLN